MSRTTTPHPPPLTSKYQTTPTAHELEIQRQLARNEKARVRMARKRQELKSRPIEEQRMAAARARAYQATYRQKHRSELRKWEAQRRMVVYQNRHGLEAAKAYLRAKRERKRQARAKLRAKDGHFDVDVGANDATDVRS